MARVSVKKSSHDTALALARRGYSPLPTAPKTKAVLIKDWQELRIRPADVPAYFKPDADVGVGMLLGVEAAPRCYPIGIDIDVDEPELIERVALAFDRVPPAKKGSKGITYFCRVGEPVKKKYVSRKDPTTGARVNVIELLATGQQTILPPSVHPKGMEYEWVGEPLYDVDPNDLPELTPQVFQEIEIAVHKPSSNVFFLNVMESGGGNGGGTIHNSVLSAVATLTGLTWTDDAIWQRVWRATQRAMAKLPEVPREYTYERWEPVVRKMIEDARAKGFDQTKKVKIHRVVASWLINEWKGVDRVRTKNGQLHAYDQGWWKGYTDPQIRRVIAHTYPEPAAVSLDSPDWVRITNTSVDMSQEFPRRKPKRRVCLLNGTFDMDDGELRDWSHEDYLINQLGFKYDADAQCPTYEMMLQRAFMPRPNGHDVDPDDLQRQIDCFEEFVAHTLFECLDYHKFLVIKGQPRTGKSTLLKVIQMLHGEDALSSVPVHEFGNERYRTAMVGKLLNLVTEVAATSHVADDFLKSVSAGDEVTVRFLYREPQRVRLPTRIIVTCNEMFRVRDTSGAIEARMLILSCDNFLEEKDRDPRLPDKLESELPGIFNRMVNAWQRLRDRGHFIAPRISTEAVQEFTTENNLVLAWMKERTWQGAKLDGAEPPDQLSPTEASALYMDFAEWSKMNGHKQMSKITFGMKLSQLRIDGLSLEPALTRVAGHLVRVRNLTLIDTGRM